MAEDHQRQPYDSALKSLMEDHAAEMLPELLTGCKLIDEKNAELPRTNLRPDLVYLVEYRGGPHILNLELQTKEDADMAFRMLAYHIELLGKYRLPVISMVVYPFETNTPETVFRELSGTEELLTFHYKELKLWTKDAREYKQRKVISMYTLLPAMHNATTALLKQAIDEMDQAYVGLHLARHLVRFRTILRRSATLSLKEKQEVEEHLHMYESILDWDPEFQERVADAELRGRQKLALEVIQTKYPGLKEPAEEIIIQMKQPELLSQLIRQILTAPDESSARWLLDSFAV